MSRDSRIVPVPGLGEYLHHLHEAFQHLSDQPSVCSKAEPRPMTVNHRAGPDALVASVPDPYRSPAVVVPPINFAMVAPGVYRSGHPNKKNFGFLRGLGLKGIMWVSHIHPDDRCMSEIELRGTHRYVEGTDEYRKDSMDFVRNEGIQLHRYDLSEESVRMQHSALSSLTGTLATCFADL